MGTPSYLATRVECLNDGCFRYAVWDSHHDRNKPFCTRCMKAGRGECDYAEGVTPFKKDRCDNEDGSVLGDKCPVQFGYDIFKNYKSPKTQIDHIDGDPNNNVPENCQELCYYCHGIKSTLNGDQDSHKRKR